jgi:MFS family permease
MAILALALIMGAADSLWATAREIAGIDLAQRHQRGRVISSLHGTYNIGTAMGPFLGGWLTDVFSFKAAFVAYAIATALSVFLGIAGPDFPVAPATQKVADARGGWGLTTLKPRLLGLGDLFKEIPPDLRATYLALCLATLSSQSRGRGRCPIRRLSRQHIQSGRAFPILRSLAGGVSDPPGGSRKRDAGAVAQTPLS